MKNNQKEFARHYCLCGLGIIILLFTIINFESYFNNQKVLGISAQMNEVIDNRTQENISFWKSFLTSNPNYFDGWIELTDLLIKNGNYIEANESLEEAKSLNPNSPEILVFEQLLFLKQ